MNNRRLIIILTIVLILLGSCGIITYFIISNLNSVHIDNFSNNFNIPSSKIKDIQNMLYDTVSLNVSNPDQIPSSATIRDDTISYDNNELTNTKYGSFIVDLPSLEQSYFVQFEVSDTENDPNLSSTNIVVTCPPDYYQIYNFENCIDDFSNN